MKPLLPDVQAALVREAARAPSVHNVQPARWRFEAGGVTLLRAPGRELPVGDPTGHDLAASLGAAWEGMSIALSRVGCTLGPPVPAEAEEGRAGAGRDGEQGDVGDAGSVRDAGPSGQVLVTALQGVAAKLPGGGAPPLPIARATIRPGATTADALAPYVLARRSFRGRFAPPTDAARARLRSVAAADAIVVDDRAIIDEVARLHDAATWHFESRADYHAELWSWLRLSPGDPRWSRDGLNADCLALSRAERSAARVLLRPRVFSALTRLGVARHLVSESAQVRGATGLLLFAPSRALSAFDVGRRFYRLWLELTAAGLHAAPMSATSDFAETRDALARRVGLGDDRRLANVLRVGIADGAAESPRLGEDELLVT